MHPKLPQHSIELQIFPTKYKFPRKQKYKQREMVRARYSDLNLQAAVLLADDDDGDRDSPHSALCDD